MLSFSSVPWIQNLVSKSDCRAKYSNRKLDTLITSEPVFGVCIVVFGTWLVSVAMKVCCCLMHNMCTNF